MYGDIFGQENWQARVILAASKHTTLHLGKPHYKELASQKTVLKLRNPALHLIYSSRQCYIIILIIQK